MKTIFHATAGIFSAFMLMVFFVSTIAAEILYTYQDVIVVQQAILQAMWAYFPLVFIAGSIGIGLSKERKGRIVENKKMRMLIIVLGSILILLPCSYLLANQPFDNPRGILLIGAETLELATTVLIIVLLGLNFRDGTKLISGRPTGL